MEATCNNSSFLVHFLPACNNLWIVCGNVYFNRTETSSLYDTAPDLLVNLSL
jgi:hypothetical protein